MCENLKEQHNAKTCLDIFDLVIPRFFAGQTKPSFLNDTKYKIAFCSLYRLYFIFGFIPEEGLAELMPAKPYLVRQKQRSSGLFLYDAVPLFYRISTLKLYKCSDVYGENDAPIINQISRMLHDIHVIIA